MRVAAARLVAICCAAPAAIGTAQESSGAKSSMQAQALSVAEALDVGTFADGQQLALSVDGRFAAFTFVRPRRAAVMAGDGSRRFTATAAPTSMRGAELWVTDLTTGVSRNLTGERGASWSGTWSPDGRRLAFLSDRDGAARLWIWERESGTMRRLSERIAWMFFGFEEPCWSPDGKAVLLKVVAHGTTLDESRRLAGDSLVVAHPVLQPTGGSTARSYTTDAARATASPTTTAIDGTPSFLNASLGDLVLVRASDGDVTPVATRVRAMAWRFSPNGEHVAYSTRQPYDSAGALSFGLYDLWVVDTRGGAPRQLGTRLHQDYGLAFSWSPDGRRIAYVHDGALEIIAAAGGAATRFNGSEGRFGAEDRPPLWIGDSALLALSRDTLWRASLGGGALHPVAVGGARRLRAIAGGPTAATLIVVTRDTSSYDDGIARLDLTNGAVTPLFESAMALTDVEYGLAVSSDGARIAFQAERSDRPPEVWAERGGVFEPVTTLNATVAKRRFGTSRLVSWRSSDGTALRGALLLPPGYVPGTRLPLVVSPYGGERLAGRVHRFGLESGAYNMQLLATRGYAVLLPDAPTRPGSPMRDIADAVLPAIDTLIAAGIADSARVGVFGHSYGGYSALALAVQTTRLKAVVSSAGFGNLFTHYAGMRTDGSAPMIAWAERGQGSMNATPWEARDRYLANSPFFVLDEVNAPVLLLHGGADDTVFPERSREVFVALRRLGKTAELVLYDGEPHAAGAWRLANVTDYWARIIGWFDRYLR